MTNYIDAEELKQKINSLKNVYNNPNRVIHGVADAFRQDGRVAMCNDIMNEIESLQYEQPDADLEAEIERMIYDPLYDLDGVAIKYATKYITVEDVADLARHFAEWGTIHPNAIQSIQQEQSEVDLEKEYKKWWDSIKYKINTEHTMEWYMHETARRFYELGLNARK